MDTIEEMLSLLLAGAVEVLDRSSPHCVDGLGADLGFCGSVVWLY
jgi:hypothetical protein